MLDTAATGDLTLAACSEVEVVLQKEEITVRVKSSVLSTAVSETSSHSESALCLHLSPELSPEGSEGSVATIYDLSVFADFANGAYPPGWTSTRRSQESISSSDHKFTVAHTVTWAIKVSL